MTDMSELLEEEAEETWEVFVDYFDDADKSPGVIEVPSIEKDDWVPYTGPQGGEGWQNVETGEVIYDDTPPGSNEELEEFFEADFGALLDAVEELWGYDVRADVEDEMREEGVETAEDARQFLQENGGPEDFARVVQEVTGENISDEGVEEVVSEMSDEELEPSDIEAREETVEEGDIIVTEGEGEYEGETIYGRVTDLEAGYRGDEVKVEWAFSDGISEDTHRTLRRLDAQIVEGSAPEVPEREDYADDLTAIEDIEPVFQIDRDLRGEMVLLDDGFKARVNRVDTYDDTVKLRLIEDGESVGTDEFSIEEAEERIVGTIHEDADPEDFGKDKVMATTRVAMAGVMEPVGAPEYDWHAYEEMFSQQDDETLQEAFQENILYSNEADNPMVTTGKMSMEEAWKLEYERGEPRKKLGTTHPRNMAIPLTHMDGDSVVEVVNDTIEKVDEVMPEEVDAGFSDDTKDPRPETKRKIAAAGAIWAPDNEAREKILEEHGDKLDDLGGLSRVRALNMLRADDEEEWRSSWIDGWAQKGGNAAAVLTQYAMDKFKANKEGETITWTGGRPYGDVAIPDDMMDYMESVYEETQEQLEGQQKLYRGVKGNVTANSNLESWSELKSIANKFDDHVMEAEVDAEDVFATWETLGDEWPEEEVKGKREWMVMGGALA